ncbi:hypothetical protein SDC9_110908 [bioreactor metagenome]|uniref:Uncharacterized protein n=1 Tax=bioreactor metagenome TaxID=1076179 RepID=A0A645BFA2_9ZZZZ
MKLLQKQEQAPAAVGLKFLCVLRQGNEVFLPLLAPVHGPEHAQHVQLVVNVPQQSLHAHVPGQQPQAVQCVKKRAAVLPAVTIHRVVKVPRSGGRPHPRQPVRREPEQGRAENGYQRHVLPGVVDHMEQAQQGGHLHGGEVVPPLLKGTGYSPLCQRRREHRRPASRRAHQNHDVLRAAGPQRTVLPRDGVLPVQQLPYALRRQPGLCHALFHRALQLR